MKTYYYMRISTKEERELQSYQRQSKALEKYAEELGNTMTPRNTYKDDVSGSTFKRKEWIELEERVREECKHDTVHIVFKDISRFSRVAKAGFEKYMEFYDLGIRMTFLDNPTISTDYIEEIFEKNKENSFVTDVALQSIVNLLIAIELDRAEKQREYISKAIKDGIDASDKKSGRPHGKLDKINDSLKEDIYSYLNDRNIKQIDLINKHNVCRNTLVKYIRLAKENKL